MGGRQSERRKICGKATWEIQAEMMVAWVSVEADQIKRRDGFKIYFSFYAKYTYGQIKITTLENTSWGRNNTVQIYFFRALYIFLSKIYFVY